MRDRIQRLRTTLNQNNFYRAYYYHRFWARHVVARCTTAGAISRGAGDQGPTAGLPPRFRAQAIKSPLPTLPTLPLPTTAALNSDPANPITAWQPVLPGALRYLLVGARPGAMMAIRNQLLRQQAPIVDQAANGNPIGGVDLLVSGSVPIQHHIPRPAPLPNH